MGSESDLYSPSAGARYMQCLEAFSYRSLLPELSQQLGAGVTPEAYFERTLKLHALFGGRIVITSITPVGSVVLLSLFANPDFRHFLSDHPAYLELCCNFNRDIPEDANERRALRILSGIKRTLDDDWTSSMFTDLGRDSDTELIRTVAQAVLKTVSTSGSGLDVHEVRQRLARPFKKLREGDRRIQVRHIRLMEAIPEVLSHFMSSPGANVCRARSEYRTIRSMISQDLNFARDPDRLLSVQNYIDQECGADASFSRIIATVDHADLTVERKRSILQTACYAYNSQLIESVQPSFGSYVHLPHGIPVGMTTDHFHNVLSIPAELDSPGSAWSGLKDLGLQASQLIGFDCDIDSIGWRQIAQAMSERHIAQTAVHFQDHLHDRIRNDEAAIETLRLHCDGLARFFFGRGLVQRPSTRCMWLVQAGIGASLGFVILAGLGVKSLLAHVASAGMAGGRASLPTTNIVQQWTASEVLLREAKREFLANPH